MTLLRFFIFFTLFVCNHSWGQAQRIPTWGNRTYYEILNAPENSNPDTLRSLHKRKVKELSPLLNEGTPEEKIYVTEEFKAVNAAWEVLGNPLKKEAYDGKVLMVEEPTQNQRTQNMTSDAQERASYHAQWDRKELETIIRITTIAREHSPDSIHALRSATRALNEIWFLGNHPLPYTDLSHSIRTYALDNSLTPEFGELLARAGILVFLTQGGENGRTITDSLLSLWSLALDHIVRSPGSPDSPTEEHARRVYQGALNSVKLAKRWSNHMLGNTGCRRFLN